VTVTMLHRGDRCAHVFGDGIHPNPKLLGYHPAGVAHFQRASSKPRLPSPKKCGNKEHMNGAFAGLERFVRHEMQMFRIYQPVMLLVLLASGGKLQVHQHISVVDMSGVRSFVFKVHGLLSRSPAAIGMAGVYHPCGEEDFDGWRIAARCVAVG
jgi:hypothetical protein